MTENTNNDYFTKKHARLFDLAKVASIAAWIVLIYQILLTLGNLNILRAIFFPDITSFSDLFYDFQWMIKESLITVIEQLFGAFSNLIQGVVYWLLLKGISVGLYMVLETNLNYKDKFEEVGNE